MWSTVFEIEKEAHTDKNREALHGLLSKIYEENQHKVQGFRIIWEGNRQESMIDEMNMALERFGETDFTLGPDYFSHLENEDLKNE